jgi:hypothetical protein
MATDRDTGTNTMTEKGTRLKSRKVGVSVSGRPSAESYSITNMILYGSGETVDLLYEIHDRVRWLKRNARDFSSRDARFDFRAGH